MEEWRIVENGFKELEASTKPSDREKGRSISQMTDTEVEGQKLQFQETMRPSEVAMGPGFW